MAPLAEQSCPQGSRTPPSIAEPFTKDLVSEELSTKGMGIADNCPLQQNEATIPGQDRFPSRSQMGLLSYNAQFDLLLPEPDPTPWDRKKAVPKPSLSAQVSALLI